MTYKDAERLSREARSDAGLGMTFRVPGRKTPKHVIFNYLVLALLAGISLVVAVAALFTH